MLYIVGSFKSGGTETQLVEMLRRLDRRRFVPHVLCLRREGGLLRQAEDLRVEIKETGFRKIFTLKARRSLRTIAAWASARGVRIIHGFHFHGNLYGAFLKGWCPAARLVVSEQAIHGPREWRHRIGRALYYRRADAVTANCEAVRRAVAARDGIDPARIHVIYGGVDVLRFAPRPRPGGRNGAGPVVGCVGRLHPDKGQMLLIEAAPEILRAAPEARIVLVGDGPQRGEIEAWIASRGLSGRVTLLGDRRDVPDLLAGIDLLVLPSASEGFANAALEGQASGLPVVVSDAGGNPEIVLDRETGRVFPRGDAAALAASVVGLLVDPSGMRRMGEAGRRRVEAIFPLEEMVGAHERLYERILRGGGDGAGGGSEGGAA